MSILNISTPIRKVPVKGNIKERVEKINKKSTKEVIHNRIGFKDNDSDAYKH